MDVKAIVDQLQHETQVLTGDEAKDRLFVSQNQFPDEAAAKEAFGRSIEKLMNVDGWSGLSLFSANFYLHDRTGQPKPDGQPERGDYIQITLPGPAPENWVRVVHKTVGHNRAEFTVQPSSDPRKSASKEVEHFFDQEARSTFRVELSGNTLTASEIGERERINNQEPAMGQAIINTVIAEGAWLFYQQIQWKLLTDYLVHL